MSNIQALADRAAAKRDGETRVDRVEMTPAMTIPLRAGQLLTKLTQTADFETALWKMLADYTTLKTQSLHQQIQAFETKWGMTFEEFSERCESGTLKPDPYAYEVESDFWDWEQAATLLAHYKTLQIA